jgi:hypothetical protein
LPATRLVCAFVSATILAATAAIHAEVVRTPTAPAPQAIEVHARTIDAFQPGEPSRRLFGALEFRGGLVLTSPYPEFGGLSALRIGSDGRFLSLSDKGRWFRGRIAYRDDRPAGFADVETAPILGSDGRPLAQRGWYDTESIAEDGGTLYVGIERVHQIVRFDFGKDGLAARGQPIAVPPDFKTLPSNKGIEGLVFVPPGRPLAGTLIAFSERGLDPSGNLKAYLIGGKNPGAFSVKRIKDFDISDADIVPGGDLLILERRFTWTSGVAIRIRRIALESIKPGALVDGPALFDVDMGYEIDNMEGLSVNRTPAGDILLTMISDDNFSPLQRTLLLQFRLAGE